VRNKLPILARILQLLTILFVVLMVSCSPSRKAIKAPIKEEGADYLFKKLKEHELKFTWFTGKFSAEYKNGKKSTSFNGQIRIKKDSVIWLSLTPGLGIEAMRLIITQGARPTVCISAAGYLKVPTLSVRPVDTVGAGDAFAGAFAARRAGGADLVSAIRYANCAGALATLKPGAQESIPDKALTEKAVKRLSFQEPLSQ